ncbi:MAG: Crp/Fnr family transcriptional regulator [Lachnospiraceae bacterium]|nr:Crp/Fnr family transcriptional regulator [Lachnospiraceae bacterium]
MAAKAITKGNIIFQAGQSMDGLFIIASGQVRATFPGGEILLGKGDVIGLCDLYYGVHSFTYETLEDTQIGAYPFHQVSDLKSLLKIPEILRFFLFSSARQAAAVFNAYTSLKKEADSLEASVFEQYQRYKSLCIHYSIPVKSLSALDTAEEFSLEDAPDSYLSSFYTEFHSASAAKNAFTAAAALTEGFLLQASKDVRTALEACQSIYEHHQQNCQFLLNESFSDLFDVYVSLKLRLSKMGENTDEITEYINSLTKQIESCSLISKDLLSERLEDYQKKLVVANVSQDAALNVNASDLKGSLDTILAYSEIDSEAAAEFKSLISQYKNLLDKSSLDDSSRKLRQSITKFFYPVYSAVFKKSISDTSVPVIVQMFLNFGYVDEELAGIDNALYLYSLSGHLGKLPSGQVYTFYQWLLAIYRGEKEPCRNEFDNDFAAHLRELKNTGKISDAEEARMLYDNMERVLFELENVFPMVNKITFGRITTFCPVFSEHNIFRSLESSVVTKDAIDEVLTMIRSMDYSAYYRETAYSNTKCNIAREMVQVEVLPDIILMPGIGSRGVMWQEIEGRKRTTPARMMLPIFHMEDLSTSLIRLTAEYRWEMCKRIQGARWNDVSERSLTSEYCDYAQFYRKNMDLSADNKEKVKAALQKAKNNYKEMFVNDYITWIMFEGNGSPRLNKVARAILFMHCPFSAAIRTKLASNPLYKDMLEAYNVRTGQKLHHLEAVFQRFRSSGIDIPEELEAQETFLES